MAVTINYNLFRVLAEYSTSGAYSFQAKPGIYKIECWGSAAAARSSTGLGGRGGYACAVFRFKTGDKIFVKVGDNSGFNGGGRSGWGGYGGGASDVRVGADTLNNRIIVAGGGGTCGYNASAEYYGYGGGLAGGNGRSNYGAPGLGGTQTGSGGGIPGGFGNGGYGVGGSGGYGGGGGGGWYGGGGGTTDGSGDDDSGGGGGSGYVLSETSYKPIGYIDDNYYYCLDIPTLIAGNLTMPNPDYDSQSDATQVETVIGNPGIGKVKISYIPQALYFIKHDEKLYIPNKYFFSEYYGKFMPLTEEDASKVYSDTIYSDNPIITFDKCIYDPIGLFNPFTVTNGTDVKTITPLNFFELGKDKIIKVCSEVYSYFEDYNQIKLVYKLNEEARLKAQVKLKDDITIHDELSDIYFTINPTKNMNVMIKEYDDYYNNEQQKDSVYNIFKAGIKADDLTSYFINSDIINLSIGFIDNVYNSDDKLKQIKLIAKTSNSYRKLWEEDADIYSNKDKIYIKLKAPHSELIINKFSKDIICREIDTLDEF